MTSPAQTQTSPSDRYDQALLWAAQLHRKQFRIRKSVPYISHLISVSALVWEDGGNEDQAIAGLLHDAIEDAGQNHGSIAQRFGAKVADIVAACTDTDGLITSGARKPSLLERKIHTIQSLSSKPEAAWLVIAADKAHNARDTLMDCRRDPIGCWAGFKQGAEGVCWYLSSLHRELSPLLPHSRSVEMLGACVAELLNSPVIQDQLSPGESAEAWVAGYLERAKTPAKA